MIISENAIPGQDEFDFLLLNSLEKLNEFGKTRSEEIKHLGGNKLEPFIKEVMDDLAKGTVFEGSIELISGQKFPDIVANRFYGIEVKSTTQNHWKTTGNSVLESTRVEGVERIYMMFGKLANPIEFRCRPYQDCLSEIVVTHSPRYLIDMNLGSGLTIFDKISLDYEEFRKNENPIKPIVEYYKTKLKPGQDLWWIENDNGKSSSLIIKIWNTILPSERRAIKNKSMVLFPEMFGNRSDKFNKMALWLVTNESVVCPNIRDIFTAGGKVDLTINGIQYTGIPQIFRTLSENKLDVIQIIQNTDAHELSNFWGISVTEHSKYGVWLKLISSNAILLSGTFHINMNQMINNMFS